MTTSRTFTCKKVNVWMAMAMLATTSLHAASGWLRVNQDGFSHPTASYRADVPEQRCLDLPTPR